MLPYLITALLYVPIFTQLYASRWAAIDYDHAYFILPVAAWIAWKNLAGRPSSVVRRSSSVVRGSVWLISLIAGLFLFTIGTRHDYGFLTAFSLVPVLFGLTGFLYGSAVVKALSFPILYLLFLVPPPVGILDSFTLPMRYFVSMAADGILGAFGYPITREGLMLSIGGHQLYMGAPCSGFRSLITMLALGTAYIYLARVRARPRLIMALALVPLALLGNVIRIIVLCLVTFYFGDKAAQGFFHNFSGLVIFMVMLLGLLGVEKLSGE